MRMSYNEKIERINNDRLSMFNIVKERISKDNSSIAETLDITTLLFKFDEENVKEYKSIINAKQLIFELTEEISKATSVEDVISLRKKINYYINKIKKELIKRNVNQEIFNQLYTNVSYLRNNISMYIRFLKRESTLVEISNLYKNVDSLSPEDSDKLKKLLTKELNYNRRVLKTIDTNKIIDLKKIDKKSSSLIENNDNKHNNTSQSSTKLNDDAAKSLDENISINLDENFDTVLPEQPNNMLLGDNFLIERVQYYLSQYNFDVLFDYDSTFFRNCINFFRNIPRYKFNKKIIKFAERDYDLFYHGSDLRGFIDYSKKRNSIKVALGLIFKSSRLSRREIECLFSHDKCEEWIIEFHSPQSYIEKDNVKLIRAR